jgi:ABC-type nitrate/sulfonate/bicarbonate transport system ATPase subunit
VPEGGCSYTLRDVTASYEHNRKPTLVLDHLTLSFRGGVVYAVMGRNGCGKSTMLKVLAGELRQQSGDVVFSCDSKRRNATVEYIPQDYRTALFPWKTVRGNVYPWEYVRSTVGNGSQDASEPTADEIDDALELVGLAGAPFSYPFELSGGQQQLLLLARCVVSRCRVLLLDEPFSALDIVRRTVASQKLRERWRAKEKIVICAMHEPDQVVRLADEVLVFQGPPLRLTSCFLRPPDADESPDAFRRQVLTTVSRVVETGERGHDSKN